MMNNDNRSRTYHRSVYWQEEMRGRPDRQIYLYLKDVDLGRLGGLIDRYRVNRQVIFTHNKQKNCARMREISEGVRSMLWIGGTAQQIQERFRAARDSGFRGLDQVQCHLNGFQANAEWPYELGRGFVEESLAEACSAGIDLEVLPFRFDRRSIHLLFNIGIRWFATDEPAKFVSCLKS